MTLLLPLLRAIRARVQGLSPERAWRLGLLGGRLLDLFGPGRARLRENLEIVLRRPPTREEVAWLSRGFYRHFALGVIELLREPLVTRQNLHEVVTRDGLERARRVIRPGEPVILVTGHAGQFELAGHMGALVGLRLTSMAKFSGHPGFDEFVLDLRQSGGQRVIPVQGALWAMKKALDRGEAVGINVDQQAREDPVFAPFLGVLAATSPTPAQLHLRTGAPIAVVTVERRGRFFYAVHLEDVIRHAPGGDRDADVLAITARVNAALEQAIRRRPEQWFWTHRRFRRRAPGDAQAPASPPLELGS